MGPSTVPQEKASIVESQPCERPQVLAQLAKDISDLIHGARGASAPQPGPHVQQSVPTESLAAPFTAPAPVVERPPSAQEERWAGLSEEMAADTLATGGLAAPSQREPLGVSEGLAAGSHRDFAADTQSR